MKTKHIVVTALSFVLSVTVKAQDSARVATVFSELMSICKNVDFGDPRVQELGLFYKAAPYIVYRGEDEKRKWKVAANYKDAGEKEQVNAICYRINETVNQDSSYQVVGYSKNKESEGEWHVLIVSYVKKERTRKALFAFLKIGDKYLLGDID